MTNKQIENKKEKLIEELKKGEASEFVKNFERSAFIKELHKKHTNSK